VGIVADDKLMALAAKNPAILKQLQEALTLISNQFSNVIQNKYNESPQTIINNLSPAQVNALKSQIAPIQAQINSLTSDLSNQQATLASQQTAQANAQANVNSLTAQQTALPQAIVNDQSTINGFLGSVQNGTFQEGSIVTLTNQIETANEPLQEGTIELIKGVFQAIPDGGPPPTTDQLNAVLDDLNQLLPTPFYNLWTNIPLIISCFNDT
jgi:hypothetical protein